MNKKPAAAKNSAPAEPTTEPHSKPDAAAAPKRRRFTTDYKVSIVEEVEACGESGAVNALLRREGLRHAQFSKWRRQYHEGLLAPISKREPVNESEDDNAENSAPVRDRDEERHSEYESRKAPLEIEVLQATKPRYESRILTFCVAFLTIVGLAFTLYFLRAVLVPFTLAAFLSLVLIPVIDFQVRKLRVRRIVALILTLVMGFLGVLAAGLLVSISVRQFANNASEYESQLSKIIAKAEGSKPIRKIVALISDDVPPRNTSAVPVPTDTDGEALVEPGNTNPIDLSLLMPRGSIKGIARTLSAGVLSLLSNGMLVMLFTAFLLTGRERSIVHRNGFLAEIESRVQKYIVIKIIMSMLTGILVFFVLKFLDVRYAMSFGAFAFVLNFIPSLGSIVATLLPVPFIVLRPETSATTIALAVILPMMIQFIIGSIIEPKIMGDTLGLHPVVILMALIFWGVLWGFSGMLLAVPMTAVSKIIFERIPATKTIAMLMEGRLEALDEM